MESGTNGSTDPQTWNQESKILTRVKFMRNFKVFWRKLLHRFAHTFDPIHGVNARNSCI